MAKITFFLMSFQSCEIFWNMSNHSLSLLFYVYVCEDYL